MGQVDVGQPAEGPEQHFVGLAADGAADKTVGHLVKENGEERDPRHDARVDPGSRNRRRVGAEGGAKDQTRGDEGKEQVDFHLDAEVSP